jgi:SAM-dependent methyltransferase
MNDFFSKATNQKQYDLSEMKWDDEGIDSPMRLFFASQLEKVLGDLSGETVLDIGSGTGYCARVYEKLGAKEYTGIEPSDKNLALSRKLHPKLNVIPGTLNDTNFVNFFDVAVSIMVFEHIADPVVTFRKIQAALKSNGRFYLLCCDKDIFTTSRFGYGLEIESLGNGEFATATTRSYGTMYDVLRPIENYINYAERGGLKLKRHIPLLPSEALLQAEPKYDFFNGKPFVHFLVFQKIDDK